MTAKTFNRQTAKLIAVVSENMPELSGGEMQWWIHRPRDLQDALKKAFSLEKEAMGVVKPAEYPLMIIAVRAMGMSQDIFVSMHCPRFWGQEDLRRAGVGDRVRLVVRLVVEDLLHDNHLEIVGVKEVIKDK